MFCVGDDVNIEKANDSLISNDRSWKKSKFRLTYTAEAPALPEGSERVTTSKLHGGVKFKLPKVAAAAAMNIILYYIVLLLLLISELCVVISIQEFHLHNFLEKWTRFFRHNGLTDVFVCVRVCPQHCIVSTRKGFLGPRCWNHKTCRLQNQSML